MKYRRRLSLIGVEGLVESIVFRVFITRLQLRFRLKSVISLLPGR